MTVCIAAIYTYSIEGKNRTGIIGASDRMITSHEAVEFEKKKTKISKNKTLAKYLRVKR